MNDFNMNDYFYLFDEHNNYIAHYKQEVNRINYEDLTKEQLIKLRKTFFAQDLNELIATYQRIMQGSGSLAEYNKIEKAFIDKWGPND